jgi:uncharacterized protein (DUF302 family)
MATQGTTTEKSTLFNGSYGLSIRVPGMSFEEAMDKVKGSFQAAGFGLPPGTTNLNLAGIFDKKFPGKFNLPQMHVIGFCSPPHALKAMMTEPSASLLVPCNVCVATTQDGVVEVSAVDPYALLGILNHKDELRELVEEVRAMIKAGLAGITA